MPMVSCELYDEPPNRAGGRPRVIRDFLLIASLFRLQLANGIHTKRRRL